MGCGFHKCATLEDGGWVLCVDALLACFHGRAEHVRRIQRSVAKVLGVGVVPPGGLVVGHAVNDAVAHDGRGQGRHDQALEVVKAQPSGQHAAVFGFGIRRAPGTAGFEVVSWQALFAPAGTPKPIVDKLHAEILKIIQSPEMQERIKGLGMQPSVLTPEQVQAFQKAEIEKWAQVIKAANIKLE